VERFGTSTQGESALVARLSADGAKVTALGASLFIVGNAIGPLLLGPLSDLAGRKWAYVVRDVFWYVLAERALAINRNLCVVEHRKFLFELPVPTSVVAGHRTGA
jgi:MFS family permease